MEPVPPNLDLWRAAGSAIGTTLAFVISWPSNRRDFWRRLVVSLVCGFVFGIALSAYLNWPDVPRFALASSVVCSLFAWAGIGTVNRIIKSTKALPAKEE